MAILLKISNLHGANIYCTSPFEETWTVTDSDDIPSFDENIKIIGDGCVEDLEVFIAKLFETFRSDATLRELHRFSCRNDYTHMSHNLISELLRVFAQWCDRVTKLDLSFNLIRRIDGQAFVGLVEKVVMKLTWISIRFERLTKEFSTVPQA